MSEMDMTADEAMVRRLQSERSQPFSPGWALASLLALLGVALASEYLFPSSDDRSAASAPADRSAGRAAEAGGHGRRATTPSEIPVRGWKDILLRVYSNISKHRILALAAGMTYYSILAIFPAIAALVAI